MLESDLKYFYTITGGLLWNGVKAPKQETIYEAEIDKETFEKIAGKKLDIFLKEKEIIIMKQSQIEALNELSKEIHESNVAAGWWTDLKYDQKVKSLTDTGMCETQALGVLKTLGIERELDRNMGELLCLVHSEVSEAMEGDRKNLMDDKLPHRKMLEVELADVLIRIFDIAGSRGLDLGGAIAEKRAFNSQRADHKVDNRLKENGKKY